jgi:hypothetical protein
LSIFNASPARTFNAAWPRLADKGLLDPP